ncbi:hypothetical protein FRC01_014445 [Tulasnella sp. 417]|nr:hypothetical protein FRC01_014445 [Tulasnella sp. 417]
MSGFGWLAENLFVSNGLPAVCKTGIFQVSLKFGDDFDMAGGAFIPILDRLAAVKVKALTIECTCRNGQRLINYLGEPNEDSQWPLPHLTALTIGGREELADYLLSALQHRKDVPPVGALVPLRPVMLELLDLEALDGMNRKVKKALAKCVSSSGTFIRDLSGLGDDWEDFDDDEEEEETWNGSESGVIYSPVEEAEDW